MLTKAFVIFGLPVFLMGSSGVGFGADTSKYISAEGITIPYDAQDMPDGKFGVSSFPGRQVRLSLTGETVNALLDASGEGRFTPDGKLAKGTKNFKPTQIMTNKKNGAWFKVTALSFGKDGFLVIVDETGVSYIVKFGSSFNGGIEELRK
jgi:hypothetical protein